MPIRRAICLAAAFFVLLAAGCGGSRSFDSLADQNASPADGRSASGFSLSVMPESLQVGSAPAAADFSLRETATGSGRSLEIVASNASGLKALYCSLKYDPARWTPAGAEALNTLAPKQKLLELAKAGAAGEYCYGQVIIRPQDAPGFSGSAVLARLNFVPASGAAPARQAADAPTTTLSASVLSFDGTLLTWGYGHQGDYDQNSETNIADLTPVALHYQEKSSGGPFDYASALSCVDGDNNGEVNIADVTPIGLNFQRRVGAYNVYESLDAGTDYPAGPGAASTISPLATVDFSARSGDPIVARLQFSFTVEVPQQGAVYWVRPADGSSEGIASNQVSSSNIAPVINSLDANPTQLESTESSTITADATDADGDTLTYIWSSSSGSFNGSGPIVNFIAPSVASQTVITIGLQVEDGQGGVANDTVEVTVDPLLVNHPPVINSITCNPDPVNSGQDADLTADVTDEDGDTIELTWEVSAGSVISSLQGVTTFTAPAVLVDTDVTITLTADDGNGGTDQDTKIVSVIFVAEALDHIEINDLDALPGSGTELDPYLIDGDPGSEFEVQFKAVGASGSDMTGIVAWGETSSAPGTGFSITTAGLLFVSPFDDVFEVNAILDVVTAPSIYFKVVPPS